MVDPLIFFRHLHWLDGRPLLQTMESFRQTIFREVFTATLSDGRLRYNLAVTSRGKKNWKSADLILAALFCLLAEDSPHGNQCYLYANDADQAGDDFALACKLIRVNPSLAAAVTVLKNRIDRVDGQGFLEVQAKDAIGSHGKTYRFVGFDEIHGFQDWSLLEALQLDPSRESIQWITSYAGFHQEVGSPLWDLYQAGRKGEDPRMYFSWYDGDAANPSKIVTPEYLAQQKLRLPDNLFRRLHRNEWSSGIGGFFTMSDWDACVDPEGFYLPPQKQVPMAMGVDASVKRDRTAVVGVCRIEGRPLVAYRQSWQPSPDHPLDFEQTIAATLRQVHQEYEIARCYYDPYQMESLAQRLRQDGLPMQEYPQSVPNLEAMASRLFDAVKYHQLAIPPDAALRSEASNASALETASGKFRIGKEFGKQKIDSIIALAMALQALGDVPTIPADQQVWVPPQESFGESVLRESAVW